MTKNILLLLFFLTLYLIGCVSVSPSPASSGPPEASIKGEVEIPKAPPFKIMAKQGGAITILVPSGTTREELRALIYSFREARRSNSFLKIGIPPTTPKGAYGDYAAVMIFIFTEPRWASQTMLKRFYNVKMDDPFLKEYYNHIKAYYHYVVKRGEIGCIGFIEDPFGSPERSFRTIDYEKFF